MTLKKRLEKLEPKKAEKPIRMLVTVGESDEADPVSVKVLPEGTIDAMLRKGTDE